MTLGEKIKFLRTKESITQGERIWKKEQKKK